MTVSWSLKLRSFERTTQQGCEGIWNCVMARECRRMAALQMPNCSTLGGMQRLYASVKGLALVPKVEVPTTAINIDMPARFEQSEDHWPNALRF